jgi:hypothetical protein
MGDIGVLRGAATTWTLSIGLVDQNERSPEEGVLVAGFSNLRPGQPEGFKPILPLVKLHKEFLDNNPEALSEINHKLMRTLFETKKNPK